MAHSVGLDKGKVCFGNEFGLDFNWVHMSYICETSHDSAGGRGP